MPFFIHRDTGELLAVVKRIERDLGRRPGRRFGPRVIDVEILLWEGGGWHDAALTVPHERLHERRFALVPLVEIDPDLSLPDGRLLGALATELAVDSGQSVELCPDVTLRD